MLKLINYYYWFNIRWEKLASCLPIKDTQEDIKKRNIIFRTIDNNGNGLLSLAEVDKGFKFKIFLINNLIKLGIKAVLNCDALFDCKPVKYRRLCRKGRICIFIEILKAK